jgi:drug/metabolite transporter (DMT)-like permease
MKLSWSFNQIVGLAIRPLFIAGVLLYGIATVLWIYLLSKYELSYIYPMIAFAYAFGVALSIIILKENVSLLRMTGVFLVVLGVAVIGFNK